MILWRISNHAVLDGGGGLAASGRWHSRGQRIVYCAPNPATALLEILVHLEIDLEDLPVRYRLLKIELPDEVGMECLEPAQLPEGWEGDPVITRAIGDRWLQERRTALLEVPSVLVPETWNILLAPGHPAAAGARILTLSEHRLDPRLHGATSNF